MRVSATELRSGNFPTHVHLPGERARKELHPDQRGSKPRVLSVTPRAQRPWTESNRLPILREDLSCPVDDRGHGRGRSRTRITLVRSEALYPLSYASGGRRPDLHWHRPRVRCGGAPLPEPPRHGSGRTCTCIVPFCGRAHCSSATDPNAPAAIRTRTAAVTGRHPDRVGPRGHALARRLRSSPPFRAYVVPEFVPRGSTEVGRARLARASAVLETARLLVTDTAPWDRERESNARLEGHNLASWPLDDRGHWVAAQGVAPRSPAHEAGMFRLRHAAMEGLEKRGSAGRWGESNSQRRVYWTRARPILASAAGSRNAGISAEKSAESPGCLHPSRTPRTVVPIASGCCGQR